MFTFKHLVSRPFTALYRSMTGYRPFLCTPSPDIKVVETSRYSHATDRLTGARVYMSKSSALYSGTTVTTGEIRPGDTAMTLVLSEAGRAVKTLTLTVTDAKAIAATLASACMKAQRLTGEKMARSEWQTMEGQADRAKADAAYAASLFD
jgi:hypothetical protein